MPIFSPSSYFSRVEKKFYVLTDTSIARIPLKRTLLISLFSPEC